MKKINFAVRFGIFALLLTSVAFAGSSSYGPFPPPEIEDGAALRYGPFPPPEIEDGA